jgi:predicted KAP-like P-loop ATPase
MSKGEDAPPPPLPVERPTGTLTRSLASSDRPIRSASQDLLGRRPFAETIADAMLGWTGEDSVVVALVGDWGTGKSSVKNMVRERFESVPSERRPRLLEFSPWQWSGSDQLAAGFFRELGIALGLTDPHQRNTRLAKLWTSYAATLRAGAMFGSSARSLARGLAIAFPLLALLGFVAPSPAVQTVLGTLAALSALAAAFFQWGGSAAQTIADVFTARTNVSERTLEQLKGDLATELRRRKQSLIVIVDDVDRLSADEIPLLFQLVKANADFPNVLYFLLFQRELVERALDRVAPGGGGRAYLEKIVQVPFTLPPVERSRLEAVLFAGLDDLLLQPALRERFDQQRWGNIYLGALRPFFQTLRDVRRYLDTLAFHVGLFRRTGAFEVNPIDLIAVEVLRVFEPDLYSEFAASKDLLTGDRPHGKQGADAAKKAILALGERARPSGREDEMRALIRYLFPAAAWAFDDIQYQAADDRWYRDLRVGHPDVFDRYFLLAIPERDISEAELRQLRSIAHDRRALAEALGVIDARGLLPTALDRLDSYKEQIPVAHAVSLATAIYDVGDDLGGEMGGSFYVSGEASASRIVRFNLLQETNAQRRAELLEVAMRATTGLYLPVRQVSLEDGDRSKDSGANWLVEESNLPRLRAAALELLEAAAADGSLERQRHLGYLLFRWREWAGPEAPTAYVQRLISSDEGLVRFPSRIPTGA